MEECILADSYLIVLGAGPQQICAYQTASRLGLKTLAIDYNPKAPARKLADKFLLVSIKDKKKCLAGLKRLNLKYKGIVSPGVEAMIVASFIAKEFGLISVSEEVAYNTTNKCARSIVLQKAGIPIPKFEIIDRLSYPKMKFPFVVKPSDSSGSRGVRIVSSKKEWPKAYKQAKSFSSNGKVIVEELLKGDEISIEGIVIKNKMFITAFADRNYIEGYYPYFMEDGSTAPTILKKAVVLKANKVFTQAAKALDVVGGPCKGDLIVTKKGIKVFEITSRLSPGFSMVLPYLTGADILEATIRWAVGMKVPHSLLKQKFNKGMAHHYFCHQPGRIKKIRGLRNLKNQPGVKALVLLRKFKVGDVLEKASYINRLLYIYVVEKDRQTAIKLAKKALATVNIEVEPIKKSKVMQNKKFLNKIYSLVFLLAIDFKKTKDGKFELCLEDKFGALDNGFRLKAAEYLYKKKKTKKIIIAGGMNKTWKKWKPDVIGDKIQRKIPDSALEKLYCKPGNTCGKAKTIIEYIVDNQLWKKKGFIGILTNQYHLDRIIALLEYMLDKKEYKKVNKSEKEKIKSKLKKISAERIIKNWGTKIDKRQIGLFYKQESMNKRIINEKQGLEDIKNNKYPCSWD